MNSLLDMTTVLISLVIGNLFTLLLVFLYRQKDGIDRSSRTFFAAKVLQSAVWAYYGIFGKALDLFSILFGNTVLFLGIALETSAILMLLGRFTPLMKRFYIGLSAVSIVGFQLVALSGLDEEARTLVASLLFILFVPAPAYLLLSQRKQSLLKGMMGALYAAAVVLLVGRVTAVGIFGINMGLLSPNLFQTVSFLGLYLLMILGNTGFALMSKEKTDGELLRWASLDDLTGVMNRRAFGEAAEKTISGLKKAGQPFSFILFDIDEFKAINDEFGHDAGDRVLQHLTAEIKGRLGSEDLFGRFGGDEFAILLPGQNEERSRGTAERLRSAIESASFEGLPLRYTISLGVVTIEPNKTVQLSQLYKWSDLALYDAKKKGRNQVANNVSV
ncbi:GGDEF domain-containing protein [Cohnella faecalis]|uniref:GGDEF domain-containing protein n=1 Tax=Cohnella faecalis TaxID=2315694 RepID=A0A398CKV9_9BACL|nr:GGDEF domain-containing protein [Cohnella faecalis]RIE01849.1 GGDEF domain-containing protein [Cohnella faecalis]